MWQFQRFYFYRVFFCFRSFMMVQKWCIFLGKYRSIRQWLRLTQLECTKCMITTSHSRCTHCAWHIHAFHWFHDALKRFNIENVFVLWFINAINGFCHVSKEKNRTKEQQDEWHSKMEINQAQNMLMMMMTMSSSRDIDQIKKSSSTFLTTWSCLSCVLHAQYQVKWPFSNSQQTNWSA